MSCSQCSHRFGQTPLLHSALLFLLTLVFGCGQAVVSPDEPAGQLNGNVTHGLRCGAEQPGLVCSEPVTNRLVVVKRLLGEEFIRIRLDPSGKFSVNLPVGKYLIEVDPLLDGEFSKGLPAEINIEASKTLNISLYIDSGFR